MTPTHSALRPRRRGTALAELAATLSVLALIALMTCDYARLMAVSIALTNCSCNGAQYASDATYAAQSPYTSTTQAALADAGSLSPAPTVTSTTGTDASGVSYVDVTVSYTFQTIVTYPGIPASTNLSRTIRMAMAPQ